MSYTPLADQAWRLACGGFHRFDPLNSVFVMHPDTLTALRKERGQNGELTNFAYQLFGFDVQCSDAMPFGEMTLERRS